MRAGLTMMVERSRRYRVVLHLVTAEALINALEGGAEVDLLLMDVRPPDPAPCSWLCWLRAHRPAVRTDKWLQRTAWMDRAGARWWPIFGAVYFVVAAKRVRGVRLLGPAWKPRRAAATASPVPVPNRH